MEKFRSTLSNVHTNLAEQGKIESARLKGKAKVVYLWNRYRRVAVIAASIAGITTIAISAFVWALTPKAPVDEIEKLKGKLHIIENKAKNRIKK